MLKYIILLVLCCSLSLAAQDSSSVVIQEKPKGIMRLADNFLQYQQRYTHPNPSTSVKLALLLPGSGQIYNRQGYKTVIFFGGVASLLYAIDFNKTRFDLFDEAYQLKLANNASPEVPLSNFSERFLQARREAYRKNLERSYIGMVLLYGVSILDAFVSAHLATFEVSKDLTLEASTVGNSMGLSLTYRF